MVSRIYTYDVIFFIKIKCHVIKVFERIIASIFVEAKKSSYPSSKKNY